MSAGKTGHVSEQEAMEVAEASRETQWKQPSFMREMFLGNFRFDLLHPFPNTARNDSEAFLAFYDKLKKFLEEKVDSALIDETGEYPEDVLKGLRELGAFGIKIPKEYGGLGYTQSQYSRVMQLIGSRDANILALLSAHQSIGVPQPLKMFGTRQQKEKYLPMCARGEISAFALTESDVGSDPARLKTVYEVSEDGRHYILNGNKLWCTNGTIATLFVVMAKEPTSKKISAFVVESGWEGVAVEQRCRFMGLKALANGVISFTNVKVPVENLIGKEGRGLKIALSTLNDGRLSIPAGSTGVAKAAVEICRQFARERIQWGHPVGRHEAVAQKLSRMAATTFAMESISMMASEMSTRGGFDIRLEASAAKEWNTARGWEVLDDAMQIRGGRGYETETSLISRGEKPHGIERMMRDFRINRIFEGSSEIMHLIMAREALDKHLEVAGDLLDMKRTIAEKMAKLPGVLGYYAKWYPLRWLHFGWAIQYGEFGRFAKYLRFIDRSCSKLARQTFHAMIVIGPKLQYKQGFLFRLVDIANELFAMAASISRVHMLQTDRDPAAQEAGELVDIFCRNARRTVKQLFHDLWHNEDSANYRSAQHLLDKERFAWMRDGIVDVPDAPAQAPADAGECRGSEAAQAEALQEAASP